MSIPLHRLALAAVAAAGIIAAGTGTAGTAATAPVSAPRVVAHLDLAGGQQPENIALEPTGAADVTFGFSGQVARVTAAGQVQPIGQVPVPADGDVPVIHRRVFLGGIVLAPDGNRYVAASTGTAAGTGIYRVRPGRAPVRIAALPAGGFLNGMAADLAGNLYIADSALGTVWRVPARGGPATAWATGAALAPGASGFGANGLRVHGGAVWVSNLDAGTLVRIPFTRNGAAGTLRTMAGKLGPIDDFAFVGAGDTVLAAINQDNRVILVHPDGTARTVLTAADGLSNPTSVAVRGGSVYITDAAYFTQHDPNLLAARLAR